MSVRRSERIASMYGALYSNIPSVTAQKRKEKQRKISKTSLAEEMKKKYEEMKKEQARKDGPLACRISWYGSEHYDVSFNNRDGWAEKRYVTSLLPGLPYDLVLVKIEEEDHSGYCSDADELIVRRTGSVPLYFARLEGETPLKDMLPLNLKWEHIADGHYWCNARDRYTIIAVESIIAPPLQECDCESCR